MLGFSKNQGDSASPVRMQFTTEENERLCQSFAQTARGGSLPHNVLTLPSTMQSEFSSGQLQGGNQRKSKLARLTHSAWQSTVAGAKTRVSFWLCCGLLGGLGFLSALNHSAAQTPDAPAAAPTPDPTLPGSSPAASVAPGVSSPSSSAAEPAASPSTLPNNEGSILAIPPSQDPAQTVPNGTSNEGTGNLFNDTPTDQNANPRPGTQGAGVTVTSSNVQQTQADIDQLTLATFHRAQTNAEALYEGVGGVPLPLNPAYFNALKGKQTGYIVGPFTIQPILNAGVSYRSISGNQGNTSSGFYGFVSPTALITLGEPALGHTITAQYGGSLSFGEDSAGQRIYNQTLTASGTWNFVKLNLGFGLDFSQLSGSDRDFGGQDVNREIVGLSLSASYIYSEKFNISTSLSAPLRIFGKGSSSEGVNETTLFNYVYSPVTTVGLGFGLGTVQVENGPSQYFEQPLLQVTYLASALLSFNGTLGCDFRQVGDKQETAPIFGLGLAWNVRATTSLSLLAERRIVNSAAISGANYTSTNFSLSVSQVLGTKYQVSGTVGLEDAEYESVVKNFSTNRHDVLVILQGNFSAQLSDRWVGSVLMSYGKNYSGRNGIDTFQSSLQLSYVF